MEDIIAEFDKVIESYNEEYTKAITLEEQEKVNSKWESIINDAETKMEKSLEEYIVAEEERLIKEQEESVLDIEGEDVVEETDEEIPCEADLEKAKSQYPNKTSVRKLREQQLVELALSLCIEASVDDKKKDTLNKVLNKLNY